MWIITAIFDAFVVNLNDGVCVSQGYEEGNVGLHKTCPVSTYMARWVASSSWNVTTCAYSRESVSRLSGLGTWLKVHIAQRKRDHLDIP